MTWFIKSLGIVVLIIGALQIIRSLKYPQILSKWNMTESKINLIVWMVRIGGVFGILVGIWMLFFVKV